MRDKKKIKLNAINRQSVIYFFSVILFLNTAYCRKVQGRAVGVAHARPQLVPAGAEGEAGAVPDFVPIPPPLLYHLGAGDGADRRSLSYTTIRN